MSTEDQSRSEFEAWVLREHPDVGIEGAPDYYHSRTQDWWIGWHARGRTERASALEAGWQPIETAPKDGANVLLVNRKGNIAAGLWQGFGSDMGWWLRGGNRPNTFFNDHFGPTHWMPLPDAPVETKEG